jgi:hypothetical protein
MSQNDNQIIERYLETMLQQIGDGNLETREVKEEIRSLRDEYVREREAAKKDPSKEKEFERYQKTLAGALPGITKGTLDAVTAFQKSPPDIVVGSAAVVDICASLASALGGLSAAGGPPGALLGAMFSMVSMILGFFAPQPPSLISQIEEMLRDLRAETEASEIKSAEEAVLVYRDSCEKYMTPTPEGGVQPPDLLTTELGQFNLSDGNTIKSIRTVRDWLRKEGNWDLDGWPELLNLQCQVYMNLMLAVTRQNLYANDEDRIKEYVGDPPNPKRQEKWELLQQAVKTKIGNIDVNNGHQRAFLREILPIARKRGTFVASIHSGTAVGVFAASGPKALRTGTWGPRLFNYCRRVSVTAPRGGADRPDGQYDIWVMDDTNRHYAFHGDFLVRSRTVINAKDVGSAGSARLWFDLWPQPSDASSMFSIYVTRHLKDGGGLGLYSWSPNDPKNLGWDKNWIPWWGKRMLLVRVATPARALPGDPDGPVVNGGNMYYATLDSSRDIYVLQYGTGGGGLTVPMASYNGLAVDPHFLWVFGNEGVVCASHASVQAFFLKKRAAPNWLGPPKNNKTHVLALSACGDGTLALYKDGELASGLYRIDFAKQNPQDRFTVDWEKWADLRWVHQMQKLPVLGWPLLDASIQSLTSPATDLVRPSFLLNEEWTPFPAADPDFSEVKPELEAAD